ncbi:hypothetical protein EON82_00225 [bacterium]|nr:MAG: hypothetical protein EON82_00225 [bacterium]
MCEIILAKNRHGEIGMVPMRFNGALMKFSELESEFLTPVQPEIFTPPPVPVQAELTLKPNYGFDHSTENITIKPSHWDDNNDRPF